MMQAAPKQPSLTVDYLLEGLASQRTKIQEQIIQQSLAMSMLPKGLFNGLRRAYELMIQDLFKEESALELAIAVLEDGDISSLSEKRVRNIASWGNFGPVHFPLEFSVAEYRRIGPTTTSRRGINTIL